MNLNIVEGEYENITEIYVIGSNAVHVVTRNERTFRIFAEETIRGPHRFSASYDELIRGQFDALDDPDNEHSVWIRSNNMPWQDGNSIEGCIRAAMHWVNERGG
ncbi:MAG: hypothetical protein JJU13_15075 [Balneolaceae bacterium]|nr:hypothetical protein [Balneolaceae bacterium]